MVDRVIIPVNRPFVDDKKNLTKEARLQMKNLESRTYILGDGPPEGIVSAQRGQSYKDLNGTTGTISYFKSLADIGGDTSLGWILE